MPTTATGRSSGMGRTDTGNEFSLFSLYSSISTWALIPPNPNALTAHFRLLDPFGTGHSSARVCTWNIDPFKGLSSGAFVKLAEGGKNFWFMATRVLIIPQIPAAVNRWPVMDLTDPSAMLSEGAAACSQTSHMEESSTLSPTGVAEPWHSTYCTSDGDQPACWYASFMARTCPSEAGATRLPSMSLDAPQPVMTP